MAVAPPGDHRCSGAPSEPCSSPPGEGGVAADVSSGGVPLRLSARAGSVAVLAGHGQLGNRQCDPVGDLRSLATALGSWCSAARSKLWRWTQVLPTNPAAPSGADAAQIRLICEQWPGSGARCPAAGA